MVKRRTDWTEWWNYNLVGTTETWWDSTHNWHISLDGHNLYMKDGGMEDETVNQYI